MEREPAYEAGGAGLVTTVDELAEILPNAAEQGNAGRCEDSHRADGGFSRRRRDHRGAAKRNAELGRAGSYSYGNLMRKLTEPEHAATLGSYGEYGWDGWLGPYMSVAPGKDLIILVMEQLTGAGTSTYTRRIRNIVYSEI